MFRVSNSNVSFRISNSLPMASDDFLWNVFGLKIRYSNDLKLMVNSTFYEAGFHCRNFGVIFRISHS